MMNFSDAVNAGYTKMVELYNALPSKQEVKQKVDAAVAFATPYAEQAVTVAKLFAERVAQKIDEAVTYATPYVQRVVTAVKPYALHAKQKASQAFNDVSTYFAPVPAEKLTSISNKAQALNTKVEELNKAIRLVCTLEPREDENRAADVLSLQIGLADLEYKLQKTLRSLEKIKTKAPDEHKANRKIVKAAIEGLCNTISQEGVKAITALQAQAKAKLQQVRENAQSISVADDFEFKMCLNRLEQTAGLISSVYKSVDAMRHKIISQN